MNVILQLQAGTLLSDDEVERLLIWLTHQRGGFAVATRSVYGPPPFSAGPRARWHRSAGAACHLAIPTVGLTIGRRRASPTSRAEQTQKE